MNGATERGLSFLLSKQDPAGFWNDWELPVGSSSMWTTAYVGWRLTACQQQVADALEHAAGWLKANELEDGGWGYAVSTGADADSTALAILFFCALGQPVSSAAVQRLLSFNREDGGFATYGFDQSFGAWTASQVEVTATAALALQMIGGTPDYVKRAAAFLHRRRRPDGLWNSYWWVSTCYATEIATRLIGERARQEAAATLRDLNPLNSFEAALRCLILSRGAGDFIETQAPDGSWPSAPILRLTDRDVYDPKPSDKAGPCFADQRRIFTTATVVSALAATINGAQDSP